MNTAFDTLTYAKKLKEAGFTERQAEAQAEALRAVVDGNLATKQDLKELETGLRRDIKELETTLRRDIKELDTALRRDIKELDTMLRSEMRAQESRITMRLGGLIVAGVGVLAVLIKLL